MSNHISELVESFSSGVAVRRWHLWAGLAFQVGLLGLAAYGFYVLLS